jgi:Family of unknown function (DUF6325)
MTDNDVHGPVDFVLLEFPDDRLEGRAAAELLDLVNRGIIAVFDLLIVGKTDDGDTYGVEMTSGDDRLGGFEEFGGARSGLLTDEDMQEAASVLEPGRLAALIVYENTWAVPFVAAAREAGGELVAGARIPAQDVMDALDALESLEASETMETMS